MLDKPEEELKGIQPCIEAQTTALTNCQSNPFNLTVPSSPEIAPKANITADPPKYKRITLPNSPDIVLARQKPDIKRNKLLDKFLEKPLYTEPQASIKETEPSMCSIVKEASKTITGSSVNNNPMPRLMTEPPADDIIQPFDMQLNSSRNHKVCKHSCCIVI